MNQLFNAGRWWKLVVLHWAENRRRYLLSLTAIAGLMLVWFCLTLSFNKYNTLVKGEQFGIYFFGLFFCGCLYASMLFADLGKKREATQFLSVPASQLEKLLCAVFFGVVLFFIAYTCIFYLLDIPMVGIAKDMFVKLHGKDLYDSERRGVFNIFVGRVGHGEDKGTFYLLMFFFALQALFGLGSVYFARYSFIKTVVSLLMLSVLGIFLFCQVMDNHLPNDWHFSGPFSWSHYNEASKQLE